MAYANRCGALVNAYKLDEALKDCNKAISLLPKYAYSYHVRGIIYTEIGKNRHALLDFARAFRFKFRKSNLIYYRRSIVYEKMLQSKEAIADLTESIRLNDKHPLAYRRRGLLWMRTGKYDLAIKDFTRSIGLDLTDGISRLARASAYARSGNLKSALVDYQSARVISPKLANDHKGIVDAQLALAALRKKIPRSLDRALVRVRVEKTANGSDKATRHSVMACIVSATGHVVTTHDMTANATSIIVDLGKGDSREARIVGSDRKTNISLLKISGKGNFAHVEMADRTMRPGDWVLLSGAAGYVGDRLVPGIVSHPNRRMWMSTFHDFIQIQELTRQQEGGPVFTTSGKLAGLVSSRLKGSRVVLAIPASTLAHVVERLKADGRIVWGYLGLAIQNASDAPRGTAQNARSGGVLVASVAGIPARNAGILPGDIITKINDIEIADMIEFVRTIAGFRPGENIAISIVRNGERMTVKAVLGELGGENDTKYVLKEPLKLERSLKVLGMEIQDLSRQLRARFKIPGKIAAGILVTEVDGSSAAVHVVRPGDLIVQVDQKKVGTLSEVEHIIERLRNEKRKSVLLLIQKADWKLVHIKLPL